MFDRHVENDIAEIDYVIGIAWARFDGSKILRWCPPFPEDQHHVHLTEFHSLRVFYDCDIAFYDKQERMVAYIAPPREWDRSEGRDGYLIAKAIWDKVFRDPGEQECYLDAFFQVVHDGLT